MAYRGHVLKEFDLDGALTRHPALALVDELAHSNAPGSRHAKRWQDIEEMLAAGIDVWTTLNVQHLDSLNEAVGSITGVRVWETVPDEVFDGADEVILVDLSADELLRRLKEGKVYLPEQARHATRNFFRKGNLIALRELGCAAPPTTWTTTCRPIAATARSSRSGARARPWSPASAPTRTPSTSSAAPTA